MGRQWGNSDIQILKSELGWIFCSKLYFAFILIDLYQTKISCRKKLTLHFFHNNELLKKKVRNRKSLTNKYEIRNFFFYKIVNCKETETSTLMSAHNCFARSTVPIFEFHWIFQSMRSTYPIVFNDLFILGYEQSHEGQERNPRQ